MDVTVNLYALGFFILFCLLAAVCVYLIIALKSLNKIFTNVNKIAETNSESINKTLAILPEVTKNVNDVAIGVKDNLDKVGTVVGALDGAITETVATVSQGTENILNIVTIASSVIKTILNLFSSDKKD